MSTTQPPSDGRPADGATSEAGRAAEATHRALLERWNALLISARDGAEGPDPTPYGEDLLGRWAEPHRRYHSTAHLRTVLDRLDELAAHLAPGEPGGQAPAAESTASGAASGATSGTAVGAASGTAVGAASGTAPGPDLVADLDAVRLAAWFHDAVYRPDRSENEERSARLAERALPEAGVAQARTAEVARLVRLTVSHDPAPGDLDGELLCDADLAVLAGTPEQYAHYAAEIRQEYAFVPDAAFREGRSTVLHQLLGLPHLYRTPYARTHWEPAARHNLTTELRLLQAQP
ncbi:hypothetical protein ACH4RA_31355 [Streptomyces smyrnaeus]|uniref:HD domain-containing protein n=1 Tax=Streptomyces smyrnaeus TaxID=1387713 RepID=UPI000C17C206